MTRSSSARSWRACRAFLAELDLHAGSAGPVPHAESCSSCAALLGSTRARIEVLRQLPRPVCPAELHSPRFLEAIHARAGEASEAWLRPVLDRALVPRDHTAPGDVDWVAAGDPEEIATSLARSLPSGPAPGWLWSRIQTEVRGLIRVRRRARWSRRVQAVGLLAAGLLLSVLALRPFLVGEEERAPVEPTFVNVTTPMESLFSPVAAVREAGRPR